MSLKDFTSEKPFDGVLENIVDKQGSKKAFKLLTISGETYFLFSGDAYKFFNEEGIKIGMAVNGAYTESEYKGNINKIIQAIAVKDSDNPFITSASATTVIPQSNMSDIELMMKCFEDSFKLLDNFNAVEWKSEDIRSVAISLFIQRKRL